LAHGALLAGLVLTRRSAIGLLNSVTQRVRIVADRN
jgi:hypothetical protein